MTEQYDDWIVTPDDVTEAICLGVNLTRASVRLGFGLWLAGLRNAELVSREALSPWRSFTWTNAPESVYDSQ